MGLGLGKVRHMEVKIFFKGSGSPSLRRKKMFEICKITGERNPTDVLTKAMSMVEMKENI